MNIKDLLRGSNAKVKVKCDYCQNEYEKRYFKYFSQRNIINKDACSDCRSLKTKESNLKIYGVESIRQVKEFSSKGFEKRRTAYEKVQEVFTNKGLLLLCTKYSSAHSPLEYICNKHKDKGIQTTTYHSVNTHDTGCRYCGILKQTGKNNWNWRGGKSEIRRYLRERTNEWKKKSLETHGYRCAISNINANNLEVHHLLSFETILQDTLTELGFEIKKKVCDYSEVEIAKIEKLFLGKHDQILGVPLLKEIHDQFHSKYGIRNNTPEQFYEFKNTYSYKNEIRKEELFYAQSGSLLV